MEPSAETQRLRLALLGPRDAPNEDRQKAAYMLREHALTLVDRALAGAGLDAMLVKGAALAPELYAPPWSRAMGDIDLLVREGQRDRVLAALEAGGFVRIAAEDDRPLTRDAFGETALEGPLGVLVEVHTGLDKMVARPVDYAAIFACAKAAAGLARLVVPSREDHAILVAIHTAGHELRHPIGLLDLHLLLEAGLSIPTLLERAERFGARTAMFVALSTLRSLGTKTAPTSLCAQFDPGSLRRRAIACFYDLDAYPPARGAMRLGLPWVLRQTPLRDDLAGWTLGLARFSALRATELIAARLRG